MPVQVKYLTFSKTPGKDSHDALNEYLMEHQEVISVQFIMNHYADRDDCIAGKYSAQSYLATVQVPYEADEDDGSLDGFGPADGMTGHNA